MPRFQDLLDVQVLVALAVGGVLTLTVFLVAAMMARPRRPEAERPVRGWRGLLASVPWVLWLTWGGTLVFGILYAWYRVRTPPSNW